MNGIEAFFNSIPSRYKNHQRYINAVPREPIFGKPLPAAVGDHDNHADNVRLARNVAVAAAVGAGVIGLAAVGGYWLENAPHVSEADVAQEQSDQLWGTVADPNQAPRDLIIDKVAGENFVRVKTADFKDRDTKGRELYVRRGQKVSGVVDVLGPHYTALLGDADNEQATVDGKPYGKFVQFNMAASVKFGNSYWPVGVTTVNIRTADMHNPAK